MTVGCCGCEVAGGRRAFLASLFGAVMAACAGPTAEGTTRRQANLAAQAHDAVAGPVIDLHAHPGAFARARTGDLPLTALDEMEAGGVETAFFAAVGDGLVIRREGTRIKNFRDPVPGELYVSTIGQLERVRARAREDRLRLVLSPGDVVAARAAGQRGALLAVEGGDPLEGEVRRLRDLHALGVRSIQLVHYRINELGDIQTEPAQHGGLTARGADVVAEMNRLGLIVDGAHASRATLLGILDVSRTPIIVSHTGPASVRRMARHLDDDLLRAVAAKGGVIGVWPLSQTGQINTFFDEIAYVCGVVGIDAVGIGTDMAGLSTFTSIPTYREFSLVPAALLARGFSEANLRKLLGANVQRVFAAAAAR
jgi:membrane dipeptidase